MLLVEGRGELAVLSAVTVILYITMLWIHGLPALLLVQGRGKNGRSDCSYCSTVASLC